MSHSDYDSPFRVVVQNIANSVATRIDEEVGKVFVETAMSINVDKDKLMEIMKQDRSRYVEAYQRGYKKRDDEIVRCEECRKSVCYDRIDGTKIYTCKNICGVISGDYFCADGERRQDDD